MHETSLVRSLLNQVEQLRAEHGGTCVTQVEVEIGPLSGVEPLLVREAFERLVQNTAFRDTDLMIQEVPLRATCVDCQAEFVLDAFRFECPNCQSTPVRVTAGDAFRLLNVTLETTSSLEPAV